VGLYSMRASKDSILFRLASAAYSWGFTPNMMTALGLMFGVAAGTLFALHAVLFAFALGSLSVFCDVLDGTLARKFSLETKFGLVFDSTADRLSEFAVVVGALIGGIIEPLGVFAIVGSASLLILRATSHRRGLKTDYVLFGRFERLLFILIGLLVPNILVSTMCFTVAGGFGLISAFQIAVFLRQARRIRQKSFVEN
jgi:CDP-diacylglycerol---glycerol-3-phosphate 3-phosphatidyltransferase